MTPPRRKRPTRAVATSPAHATPATPLDITDYLDERGWLRAPSRIPSHLDTHDIPNDLASLLRELSIAEELKTESQAANSRRNYGFHIRKYHDWCAERGLVALPGTPATVATHLAYYAVSRDEHGEVERDADGNLIANVTPAAIAMRLAAINKVHQLAGFPQPGDDPEVAQTLAGIRRTFGVAPRNAKAAIDHAALHALLAQAQAPRYPLVRDACLLVLRRAKLTSAQAARLHWADITITQGEVRVLLRADGRGGHDREVVLANDNPRYAPPGITITDLFTALADTHPATGLRHAFVTPARPDTPLTRQAVTTMLNNLLAEGNGFSQIPRLPAARYRTLYAEHFTHLGGLPSLRDSALLATGWFLALRRSNLSALTWGDVTFTPEGIRVILRRSKTDQTGVGVTHWLSEPRTTLPASVVSPTQHLRDWHAWACDYFGSDPTLDPTHAKQPVFPALTKANTPRVTAHTGLLSTLTGPSINSLVQDYAAAAGITPGLPGGNGKNPYGAHSLRAGFVTEALRGDKLSIPEVADITGHKDPRTLMSYRREVNQAHSNPVSKLVGEMGA